jgi:hypothetical protein
MKPRELAREIVACRHGREITPKVARDIGRCVAIACGADQQFDFARHVTKLLMRHARLSGRPRDPAKQRRIAQAAIFARFNAGNDKEAAAAHAAEIQGVSAKAVFRAAFERKDAPMRALIRDARKTFTGL